MRINKAVLKSNCSNAKLYKNHPNSIYTGNAYFWLAEFHLATDPVNYNEAKKNYNVVANQYPNSSKAPRALYQLYSIAKMLIRILCQQINTRTSYLANIQNLKKQNSLTNNLVIKRHC